MSNPRNSNSPAKPADGLSSMDGRDDAPLRSDLLSQDAASRTQRESASEVRGEYAEVQAAERDSLRDLTEEEIERIMATEFEETALPQPPQLPGYHLCWLSSTSRNDPLSARRQKGYRPVRREEMPSYDPSNGSKVGAGLDGFVTHNEMVLHKLPNALYERYMRYFHHTKPNDEQRTKLENIMDANEFGELTRKPEFSVGDGMEEMQNELKRATKAVPTFS